MAPRTKTIRVIHLEGFRQHFKPAFQQGILSHFTAVVCSSLEQAKRFGTLPYLCPNSDLRYLHQRAARHRAECRAPKTQDSTDETSYRKVNAPFKRHLARLQRLHWRHLYESLDSAAFGTKLWRCMTSELSKRQIRDPFAGLALSLQCSASDLSEHFADIVSCFISLPDQCTTFSVEDLHQHPPCPIFDDLFMLEQRYAIQR